MIRAIAFKAGYVEGNTCGWLVYQTPENFSFLNAKEALGSFSKYLYHKFDIDFDNTNNIDDWKEFIFKNFGSDNDSYGYDSSEEAQRECGCGWNYYEFGFGIPLDEMLIIHERAEYIFLCALRDSHNDLYRLFDEDDEFIDGPNDIDKNAYEELIR